MARKRSLLYDTTKPILAVYMHGRRVGTLGQHESDVWFKYDEWVASEQKPELWTLSIRLPVTSETYGHDETLAFFDNLLLESDTRDELASATKYDPSNLTGLLGSVGAECAGAVSVWPVAVYPPALPEYEPKTPGEIAALFDERHGERLTQAQIESRQTMSGVQHKLVFRASASGYSLPLHGSPSTVIVKRASSRYPGLVTNEMACLQVFGELGLSVPKTAVFPAGEGMIESLRYDRKDNGDIVERIHQEDFCQATGRIPKRKYQKAGGPGFKDLADVLRRHAANPGRDIENLLRASIANLCIGNMDAHAKNFSLLYSDGVPSLAPFYDVVCTEAYPALDRQMSMHIGATTDPRLVNAKSIDRLANDLGVRPNYAREVAAHVIEQLPEVWPKVANEVVQATKDEASIKVMDEVIETRLNDAARLTVRAAKAD